MTRAIAIGLLMCFLWGGSQAYAWETEYHEDFSTDPGWVTNDPANFYWTGAEFHGKQIDCQDQYAYTMLEGGYNGGSIRMEFDVRPHVQWAGNINIGLVGPTMGTFTPETTIHVTFAIDDNADHIMLITHDDNGVSRSTDWWTEFPQQNVWYHCLVEYDCFADSIHFLVTDSGETVADETLYDLGTFSGLDRFAWSGVGDHGYCGRWGEGLLDNVELYYDCECGQCAISAACDDDVICRFEEGLCGTPLGDVWRDAGYCGQALWADGAGRVSLGDDDYYSQSHFEVELWVELTELPTLGDHAAGLVTKYRGHYPELSEWGIWVEGNMVYPDGPAWLLCGNGSQCLLSAPGMVERGVLYHVRAIWKGDYAELWVDDELVASGNLTRNPENTNTPVIIGGSAGGHAYNPFHGMIDEVRIGCIAQESPLVARIDFDPNTLNLKSKGKYVTCYIELPEGCDPADIDWGTVLMNDALPAELSPTAVGDYDSDGIPDMMVKFGRNALIGILAGREAEKIWVDDERGETPPLDHGDEFELGVTGDLYDGRTFSGTDVIRVINPGGGSDNGAALAVSLVPLGRAAGVSYELSAPGPVKLQVYDAAGRLVRTLVDEYRVSGRYDITWDGRTDNGRRVGSGVYFIRLLHNRGVSAERLMIVR